MKTIREIFCDKNGNLSGKRVFGAIGVMAAIAFIGFERGDARLVEALIISSFVALGVTAFEKQS